MSKLVREIITINEKFTEDMSDPIKDLGIGGYSFENLRLGAVIVSKTNVSIARGDTGKFTYMGKGIDMPQGSPAIVLNSRNYVLKDHKEIKIWIPSDNKPDFDIEPARQNFKTDPSYSGWGTRTRLVINKKVFNSKFEVKEKGF